MALGAWCATTANADAPQIVASIKPVHSLVAGVMAGVAEPTLLVEGGASPHTYSLRPSQARALENADAVFWVGSGLETFLTKALLAIAHHSTVVALHEAEGVTLLSTREGGRWSPGDAEAHHEAQTGDDAPESHSHGAKNMHIWLDPRNAGAMVSKMVSTLGEIDPGNAAQYQKNGARMQQRLAALDATLERDLAPLARRSYIVLHDAYPYLEHRYDLSPAGAITVSPDRQPSARRLFEIRKTIQETGTICVFSEPQFEPEVVATVVEGTSARTGILDPLGASLEPGVDAYFVLMREMAGALLECLQTTQTTD
jgi:zinc transport system substrate-binding protein